MSQQSTSTYRDRAVPVGDGFSAGRDAGGVPPQAEERTLADRLEVIYRRRWMALSTLLAIVGIVTAYTYSVRASYEAHAQLLMVDADQSVVAFNDATTQPAKTDHETQYRLLQSRSLARKVLDRLDLWRQPPFAADPKAQASWPQQAMASADGWLSGLAVSIGLRDAPSAPSSAIAAAAGSHDPAPETASESRAISYLIGHLRVVPVTDTRVVEIRYTDTDPRLAASIVNTLTNEFIEQNLEFNFRASKEASQWLNEQLSEQRTKVEQSELALQRYRERGNALSLGEGQNLVVQRLSDLNTAATRARTDRFEKEALYRQLLDVQHNPDALDGIPSVFSNGFIQGLKSDLTKLQNERATLAQTLGAKHPEMARVDSALESTRARLGAEVGNLVESVHQDYLAALAEEESLTRELDDQKKNALALNRQAIDYGVLQREADSNRLIYQNLLQRANEVAVSAELKVSNAQVLDAAETPTSPVSPRVRLNLLVGLLGGLVLGVVMAFLTEHWDNRIKLPADVARYLGVPFLGMLPYVSAKTLKGSPPILSSRVVPPMFSEAFRTVRTNVLFSAVADDAKTLMVTSAAPGEGKSTVAANLAMALARSGKRVLVIDADMRQPSLHTLFNGPQQPGLSNVLTGRAKPSEAIVKTTASGLWLLTSGRCPPNPSELLGSKRFEELVRSLAASFDWVVLDGPPVMPVTDSAVLAQHAALRVFVVNVNKTRRRVVQSALERLDAAGISVTGVVLNGADVTRDRYYYRDYYASQYPEYLASAGKAS
jgi:polysaccharide biosynthesis transport protein